MYYQFMGKNKSKHATSLIGEKKINRTLSIEARFHLAVDFFQKRKFDNAKKLVNEILLNDPKHAESWFYSALIGDQEGLPQDAIRFLKVALEIDPHNLKYLYTIGEFFAEQNYLSEGVEIFELVVKLKPEDYNGYYNLAALQHKQKKYEESLLNYHKVLELDNDNINSLYNIGNILIDIKDYFNAILYFKKVIAIQPNSHDAFNNLGFLQIELGNHDEAIKFLNKSIVINPDNFSALNNLGKVYEKKSLYSEALGCFNTAIELMPDYAEAYLNRGIILNKLKQYASALINFDKALFLNPDLAEAYSNRGNSLKEIMSFNEALISYSRAIEINPDYAEAYSNRGIVLSELSRMESALANYDRAITINPNYADAYWNKSLLLLLLGDLQTGWNLYAWRWKVENLDLIKQDLPQPIWVRLKDCWDLYEKWKYKIKDEFSKQFDKKNSMQDGQIVSKRIKILFWAEQGIGDEIFYFGMLSNFASTDAHISVAADIRLHALFKRSMPEVEFIDSKEIEMASDENAFDYQASIGDIGYLCSVDKMLEHRSPKPFLKINNFKNSYFKNKNHFLSDKFVCGISWKSSNKDIGVTKSLNLIDLSPLLSIENVEFVSLQYGSTADEIELVEKNIGRKIHTIDELDIFNDIDGLASLISNCDFVVTTSNINAHLTGAIGKKGIVLMPYSKGKIWYWHSGEGQSLWYPSLELVSQSQMNDWTEPIKKCKEWLLEQL